VRELQALQQRMQPVMDLLRDRWFGGHTKHTPARTPHHTAQDVRRAGLDLVLQRYPIDEERDAPEHEPRRPGPPRPQLLAPAGHAPVGEVRSDEEVSIDGGSCVAIWSVTIPLRLSRGR
jgi:hypothetical protein